MGDDRGASSCLCLQVNAVTKHNCTALYFASYNGHAKVVKTLLIKGADRTLADEKGKKADQIVCDGANMAAKASIQGLFSVPADKLSPKAA
jgi:ankyrin repeat protein